MPAMQNKTVGIVGAGRIGAAYARMFAEGHKMDIVYFDLYPNKCAWSRSYLLPESAHCGFMPCQSSCTSCLCSMQPVVQGCCH